MAITFDTLNAVAMVAGGGIVRESQYGRIAALILPAIPGFMLIWERPEDR